MSIAPVLHATKRPNESIKYNADFQNQLATGETISSVVSVTADTPTGATALTISETAYTGTVAQARIAGGTTGYTYHVTFQVTTSDSNTREDCGELEVVEC